jgi:hypothetical protein
VPNNRILGQRHSNGTQRPFGRIVLIGIGTLVAIGGIAVAFDHYTIIPIHRQGGEKRLVFRLDAPYGSVDLRSGAGLSDVGTIELLSQDGDTHAPQWSYGLHNGTVGMLRIGIGTDEGMLLQQPLAVWQANTGFSPAAATAPQPDWGTPSLPSISSFTIPSIPNGYVWHQRMRSISTDAGTVLLPETRAGTRITLAKDLPIDFTADLGFGESSLDLSGLPITDARIETGASNAHIYCNSLNPVPLHNCSIRAGISLGQCRLNGISNLNAEHFTFYGGFGTYHLGFEGKLTRNMDAVIDIGMGMCTLSIPPTACRVQVIYEDGLLSSFSYSFSGLVERRDGYWTSPGFNLSTSPILTLHLSSSVGKISVSYH